MQIRTIVAPLLEANCYLVADAEGRAVVIDPGGGLVDEVRAAVDADGLTVEAILITHGHLDHTWSAAELAEVFGVAVHVHAADAYRLDDPIGSLGPLGSQIAAMMGLREGPPAPVRVEEILAGPNVPVPLGQISAVTVLPGLSALHAPGHTEGSTVYLLERGEQSAVAFTGDVLFAGTIGRTDLPGGDPHAMRSTLRRLARLDPATVVLPGHGPSSTVAEELSRNPYLSDAP